MRRFSPRSIRWLVCPGAVLAVLLMPLVSRGVTTLFFSESQTTNLVSSGVTSDTIASEGYLFTYTRDKLFTGGVGLTNPIGRTVRVAWPVGLEAQAVTTGPNPGGARFDLKRQDGQVFDLPTFTAKLLANTAGAGGAIEVMPMKDGEDLLRDPVMCNASGYYGQVFTYTTPQLTNADAYKITLYVDFAILNLTLVDASLPPPYLDMVRLNAETLEFSWPSEAVGYSLVAAPVLPATSWTAVTNAVVDDGITCVVDVPITAGQRFFRLKK